jgi:hypothetical protein
MLTIETFALASLLLDRGNTRWKKLCPVRETAEGIASLAGALLVATFFARIFPIVPIDETVSEQMYEEVRHDHLETESREQRITSDTHAI